MATESHLVGLVRRLFKEVFEAGKGEVADEILSPDFTFQYPFPGFPPGAEGIRAFVKVFHDAFPGFELEIHDLFASADDELAAIRWTLRGHHNGDFLGIAPTGRYVTLSAIGLYGNRGVVVHHKVGPTLTSGWLELDTLGLLQQAGAVPATNTLLPGLRG
jgi:predicted ester cyclase